MKLATLTNENVTLDREMCYNLFARSLIYDIAPRQKQKLLADTLKQVTPFATYHPDLIAKTYELTVNLVKDWQNVATRTKTSQYKYVDDRLYHIREVIEKKAVYENSLFKSPKKTKIDYWSPLCFNKGLAQADRRRQTENRLNISQALLKGSDTQLLSAIVHEECHFLADDFHRDQNLAFDKKIHYVWGTVDDVLDDIILKNTACPYEEHIDMAVAYAENTLSKVPEECFLSNAQSVLTTMDIIKSCDNRFNWYKRSPEEALVRTAQAYAALLFGQNKQTSMDVLADAFEPYCPRKKLMLPEVSQQFIDYTQIHSDRNGFWDLYCAA